MVTLHDIPHTARNPASGLVPPRAGLRDALVHRVLCPVLDPMLQRLVRRRVGAVVVLSEEARDHALAQGWARVDVVCHGGDEPEHDPVPPSRCRHVVFAGYVTPTKGVDALLRAWRRAARPGYELRIVGEVDATATKDLERAERELESDLVPVWTGFVDEARFSAEIAAAAVVVLPYTESNPASGILVRALVAGRAVVATRVDATTEVAAEGDVVRLVEPGDVEALADAIGSLLDGPATRDALGRRAAAHAARRHSWAAQADGLDRVHAGVWGRT